MNHLAARINWLWRLVMTGFCFALFGDGLGLDSIDALELGLAVKNQYGVVLSAESEEMRQHFFSVATLASFINAQRA